MASGYYFLKFKRFDYFRLFSIPFFASFCTEPLDSMDAYIYIHQSVCLYFFVSLYLSKMIYLSDFISIFFIFIYGPMYRYKHLTISIKQSRTKSIYPSVWIKLSNKNFLVYHGLIYGYSLLT